MKKYSQWLVILVQFLIGGFIGFNATRMIDNQEIDFPIMICLMFIFVLSFFLQVIIHEGGHLLFGLMSGYSFVSFRVANLMWVKENNHISLKRYSLAGTGGQCLLAPPPYQNNQYPSLLYNLGGSLLNLIITFISLFLYFIFKNHMILSILFSMLALFGIYFGFMNGIPLCINGIDNDGYNALQTHRDPYARKAFWTTLKINELSAKGIRLKDMDDALFPDISIEEATTHLSASSLVANFQRALDQKDFSKAQDILEFIHQNNIPLIGIHQYFLTNDEIYCLLITSPDVSVDHLYTKEFKKFAKAMKKIPSFIRTQYAYALLCENDETKANKFLQEFENVSKTYPYQSDINSEKELITYTNQVYQTQNS